LRDLSDSSLKPIQAFGATVRLTSGPAAPDGVYVIATLIPGDLEQKAIGIDIFHRFIDK
jgi:hypothetical protein